MKQHTLRLILVVQPEEKTEDIPAEVTVTDPSLSGLILAAIRESLRAQEEGQRP